jgi:DNA-binding transcriptional LysR family regulator
MLEGIEALIALEKYGTVSEAAIRMRLTQSAVSKRIHALQDELKVKLVEPDGRRVRLTADGYQFLNKARPLIIEIKILPRIWISRTLLILLLDYPILLRAHSVRRLSVRRLKSLEKS